MHYRLRPIESVQFRFDNLGSHFIRVQIYQIDFLLTPSILSAFKYFRYSCRGQNELFSISLSIILYYNILYYNKFSTTEEIKRGRVELCLVLLKFDPSNWCTDICKTIFVILEVQFHHERGLIQRRYFEVFTSGRSKFSPCQKSASNEAPFKLFLTFDVIFAKFAFWKIYEIFWLQNMGHNGLTKCKISFFEGLINEKQVSTFAHFLYFSKPYWAP